MTPRAAAIAEKMSAALAVGLVAVAGFGAGAASAQAPDPTPLPNASLPLPVECSEAGARTDLPDSDGDGIIDVCVDFYVDQGALLPTTTLATTTTTTVASGSIPQTGSGVSPMLGIGAISIVVGALAAVAARRRTTGSPATS